MSYDGWVRSPFGNPLRLDGQYLHESGVIPLDKQPSPGASVIPMADGGSVYQVPLHDLEGKKPAIVSAYRWPLAIQADTEVGWYLLLGISRRGSSVPLVDFDYEVETFIAGPSTTSFTLPRPTAISAWSSFPELEYPIKAYLNGVEQTVVASSPSAGEVQIATRAVTTPALSAGDRLEIHYVPSYQVIAAPPSRTLRAFGDLSAVTELVEVFSP